MKQIGDILRWMKRRVLSARIKREIAMIDRSLHRHGIHDVLLIDWLPNIGPGGTMTLYVDRHLTFPIEDSVGIFHAIHRYAFARTGRHLDLPLYDD